MARARVRIPLDTYLNGRLVGKLKREGSGAIDFTYAPSWLQWRNTFPVSISLPLREDRYIGAPVLAVFDNLLPDSEAIRRRLAERAGATGYDAFNLLAAVGRIASAPFSFFLKETRLPLLAGSMPAQLPTRKLRTSCPTLAAAR